MSPRRQARKHLAVPFAADTPLDLAIFTQYFPGNMISGALAPTAGLEIHEAHFTGGVVFDLHRAVIIDGRVAGDDADDGGGDFLPCVSFGRAGGGERVKAKEPGAQGVDVE